MPYKDLREWLELVEKRGEVKHISGASWDLEMSGISELIHGPESKGPKPALLFDDIPGYPKGYRTLFGHMSSAWRIALTLGLPQDQIDGLSLARNWRDKAKGLRLIPPKFVDHAPVQANSLSGDEIDVLRFPSPRFHEQDTGRYFGTGHTVIQKDPDSGWINLGTYRVMVVDRDRVALHIIEGRHGSIIMNKKYFAKGQVMPVAVATGLDPALWMASCKPMTAWGVSEYDYAGGIKGEAIEVIKGPYTGLPLPARAEIVIEGECHPGELVDEGPFGEWHG